MALFLWTGCFLALCGCGSDQLDCAALERAYLDAVTETRACDPAVVHTEQCTAEVKTRLTCGCPLRVNPANVAAMSEVERLARLWAAACPAGSCPALDCFEPERGVCTVQTDAIKVPGRCENDTGR